MKTSEIIEKLSESLKKNGDLDVAIATQRGGFEHYDVESVDIYDEETMYLLIL